MNNTRNIIATIFLLASTTVFADIAVIINPNNNAILDTDTIKAIYLGKILQFSNGTQAIPFHIKGDKMLRDSFSITAIGRSENQPKSY